MPKFHNPFRGRSEECAELASLVGEHRLVTVLGPGGIGKTRLAIEMLNQVDTSLEPFDLPVLFVDFAATRDDRAIPDTVAIALGIEIGQRTDPTDAVCEFLATIPHLVVIDNCEHVITAAADVAAEMLRRTTRTRILATSRMPLAVAGERLSRLGPLPVPAATDTTTSTNLADNPAAAIFLDRARLAEDLMITDDASARLVADVCRSLDGLPLALELAAGRIAAFGLEDLVGSLGSSPRRAG